MAQGSAKNFKAPLCDDRLVWDTWMSVYQFPSLCVADELGLFSALEKSPLTHEEAAAALQLGPRATEALLGVMRSMGFIAQSDGRFRNTEVARNFLLPTSPFYWGGMLRLFRDAPLSYASLLAALQKDKPMGYAGDDVWERHQVDPEQARVFTAAMHSHTFPVALGVARNIDFGGVKKFLDVGGGSACIPIAIAQEYPDIQFTIMELGVVCKLAESYVKDFGLSSRIDTVAVDMFHDPWPTGYDAIFFSNIYHDWNWPRCEFLTKRSFEALPSGGRIYLHEILLNDTKDGPGTASLFSMNMCFFTEGKQFSAAELKGMLEAAGFRDVSITHTYGYYSIVSGRKP